MIKADNKDINNLQTNDLAEIKLQLEIIEVQLLYLKEKLDTLDTKLAQKFIQDIVFKNLFIQKMSYAECKDTTQNTEATMKIFCNNVESRLEQHLRLLSQFEIHLKKLERKGGSNKISVIIIITIAVFVLSIILSYW